MLNSFNQLFYDPIQEINNFRFIKEHITFQDFISLYEQNSNIENKIIILNSLKIIFSHRNSQLNICIFNKIAPLNPNMKNEINLEEEIEINKSNYSYYSSLNNNFICWLINEYFSENNKKVKQYIKDILLLIIPIIGIKKYDISKIYEQLTKIYFYSEDNSNTNISDLLQNIKFLSGFYGLKEDNSIDNNYIKNQTDNKPYNYYYFQGKESININPIISSIEKSEIKDGFYYFFLF